MRAIKLAGNAWVSPLKTPAQFVAALESADTAPPPAGLSIDYALGTANKVIRWAFERQGLHGLPRPDTPVIGPESAMTVDLHIDDRRGSASARIRLSTSATTAGRRASMPCGCGTMRTASRRIRTQSPARTTSSTSKCRIEGGKLRGARWSRRGGPISLGPVSRPVP